MSIFKKNSKSLYLDLLLLVVSTIFFVQTTNSFDAPSFFIIVLFLSLFSLFFITGKDFNVLLIFVRTYLIGMIASSISCWYSLVLNDEYQNYSDASTFFELSSSRFGEFDIARLFELTEGSGAIIAWSYFYSFARFLNLEVGQYVGHVANTLVISLSAVVGYFTLIQTYNASSFNKSRFLDIFSCCGMTILFSAMHLRDGWIFFIISCLVYIWARFLNRFTFGNFILLLTVSSLLSFMLKYLRLEFMFVPILFIIPASLAIIFSHEEYGLKKQLAAIIGSICFFIFIILMSLYYKEISQKFLIGSEAYSDLSLGSASNESLGASLIIKQTLPIKAILGSFYLLFFPVPFWIGFTIDSAYHLFKSINALYFYFVFPLVTTTLVCLFKEPKLRNQPLLFMVFLFVMFTLVTAMTSVESRHFSSFLMPMFIVAAFPDLHAQSVRRTYLKHLSVVLISMTIVHGLWYSIKFI